MKRKEYSTNANNVSQELKQYSEYDKRRKVDERLQNGGESMVPAPIKNKEEILRNAFTSTTKWKHAPPKELKYETVRDHVLTRQVIVDNIYKPFFEHIKKSYVRVAFKNGYALCKIDDVIFGDEYKFEGRSRFFSTDIYLIILHGSYKLKIPITIVSNSKLLREEFDVQNKKYLDINEIVDNYNRVNKLFSRTMSDEEQIKTDDEKRKFIYPLPRRISFFKVELLRKRREYWINGNDDMVEKMAKDFLRMEDTKNPITAKEVNHIGRKYSLKILGDAEKVEMVIKVEKGTKKRF